ncbi:MAG: dephospho-CoA kinase [Clostridia bacterium]|nr:dephospho-CoA kinase [Clostridia bacterium]
MTQSKKIIAVTGGIGSGKSTVCSILREMGYPVFSCDEIYSELLDRDDFVKDIELHLGKVTDCNGKLDRKKLADIVFADKEARVTLDHTTHPYIMAELLNKAREAESNLVFCEVPLLFENGFESLFDDVIVVMRNLQSRIEAVKKRSGLSEEEVKARISSQYDYSKIDANTFKIVHNDGNIGDLQSTLRDIINDFSINF